VKKVRAVLLLFAVLAFGVPASASGEELPETPGFDTQIVDLPAHDGIMLRSMVLRPRSAGPHPFAVLVAPWGANGVYNVAPATNLANRGYVVMSYSTRGFGGSGGEATVGGPKDVRDVRTIIDWGLAHTDADAGRIGVGGLSYGAGIGLLAAGEDARIKAVASLSGWHDLMDSVYHNKTRSQFATICLHLSAKMNGKLDAESDRMLTTFTDPAMTPAQEAEVIAWADARSPSRYLDKINANRPAVLISHTWSETVFPPAQMRNLYQGLTGPKRAEFLPGEHASAETGGMLGLPSKTWDSVYRWFDAYVAGTDPGITREPPLLLTPRPGTIPAEPYPDWDAVTGEVRRYHLAGDGLADQPATGWSKVIGAGKDSMANAGVPMITHTLEALTGEPPTTFFPMIDRASGAVWAGQAEPSTSRIRGVAKAHLTFTPSTADGTLVAYLFDVDPLGIGRLVSFLPYAWLGATPGQPRAADLVFGPNAYDVPAGHRLSLVIDPKDPLYLDRNGDSGSISFGSAPGAPSWLDLPLR
jgi:putative CocE/NonD family hydrolase